MMVSRARAVLTLLLLTAAALTDTTALETGQHVFDRERDSSLRISNTKQALPIPRKASVQLSHSGLYIGSPFSKESPRFLSLHTEASVYDLDSIKVSAGPSKSRNWNQVHLKCGPIGHGGIEACEGEDLRHISQLQQNASTTPCQPYKVLQSQSRVLLDSSSCPALSSFLAADNEGQADDETRLSSITLSFDVQRTFPTRRESHHFWIGQVVGGQMGRALWPYAQHHESNDSLETTSWDGTKPNRVSSQMQDPYLPKAYKTESTDPLNGVDLVDAAWLPGLSISAPTNSNHSQPGDKLVEPVHSPVDGQVVWIGNYSIPMAPANHRNDENATAIMIRDGWGFVYQLLGFNSSSIAVKMGQSVHAGHIVGSTSRIPLSYEPPCRHPPADPPKMYDNSRRYPYRNRLLRIRVARPVPKWREWRGPLAPGWQFYNPLDAFATQHFHSDVPPDPNPDQLYFARPSVDGGLTPPSVFATSKDFFQPPTLSGRVEIIVGFDSFIASQANTDGSLDPTALHALDWAVWLKADAQIEGKMDSRSCRKPKKVEWRTAFEHAKLPNAAGSGIALASTSLLAHYVPAFTSGTVPFFKTKYAASFDEKSRKLYYAPTRTVTGFPDGAGYWDTRREPSGDGVYRVLVRGRDWLGNQGCFGADVLIKNP